MTAIQAGVSVARGYAVLQIDPAQRQKPIDLRIHSNPRRPVHRLTLDCWPFGNKTKDGAAALVKAAVKLIRTAEVAPESVIDLRLTGKLNLSRIALDQAWAASEIETQAEVFAVSVDFGSLDVGGSFAETELATKGFSREDLEKAAIRDVVAAKHLWGIDHREDEFSAFCYELKEAVRQEKSGTELAEQIGRSPLVELIVKSNSATAERQTFQDFSEDARMIVQSMRLKNIKSYGEGLDGDGVTISFEPGTNRVAGKNGHGKTTLIESLGYALFLTEPIFEESFQLDTYFLRAGKKAAEIDVTFSHRGEYYRIERGLGPHSRRQAKVVELEDGSTCAEGKREVAAFLCRLFDLPDPNRFSELFWKLIGVRQGRLTWPFDSKPSVAKDFFEPLLDVAVFRECFESLKPAVDEFMARLHEQERVRAAVEERIRERGDSPATLEAKRRQFREIELRLQELNKVQEDISKRLAHLEATEISLRATELQRSGAENALGLARQQREISDQRMRESAEAAAVVALVASGYNSFENAEKELQVLRAKQAEQHRLEMEIADAEKKKIELDGKSNAARSQTDVFARQRQGKEAERLNIRERVEALRNRLRLSQPEFEKQKGLANRATHYLSEMRHFVSGFADLLAHGETTLKKMKAITAALAATDASALQAARHQEETTAEALHSFRQQLAAANAEHAGLLKQLQEIGDGICPFLKEQMQAVRSFQSGRRSER